MDSPDQGNGRIVAHLIEIVRFRVTEHVATNFTGVQDADAKSNGRMGQDLLEQGIPCRFTQLFGIVQTFRYTTIRSTILGGPVRHAIDHGAHYGTTARFVDP